MSHCISGIKCWFHIFNSPEMSLFAATWFRLYRSSGARSMCKESNKVHQTQLISMITRQLNLKHAIQVAPELEVCTRAQKKTTFLFPSQQINTGTGDTLLSIIRFFMLDQLPCSINGWEHALYNIYFCKSNKAKLRKEQYSVLHSVSKGFQFSISSFLFNLK